MFKNMRLRFAVLGLAPWLAVAGACGAGDDDADVARPASSISAVPATATTLEEPPATAAPTTTTTVGTTTPTTSTTVTTTTTTGGPGPVEIVVSVEAGSVDGGGRIRVELDTEVRLIVSVDIADEMHVHGYDLFVDVIPGTPATLEFEATIPGIFEVELESLGLVLLELVVEP